MITISLIAAALAAAQYGYAPQPQTSPDQGNVSSQGFDAAPYAEVYRKCFQTAEDETRAAAADVKQQRFDACRSQRGAIVDHATAKLAGSEAADVRRALHRALGGVEKSYAKRMGVVLTGTGN